MTTDEYLQKLKQFKLQYAEEYGIERIGISVLWHAANRPKTAISIFITKASRWD
jgi:hypothetical protein